MIGKNTIIQIILTGLTGIISFFILSLSARLFGPTILGNLAYLFSLYYLYNQIVFEIVSLFALR